MQATFRTCSGEQANAHQVVYLEQAGCNCCALADGAAVRRAKILRCRGRKTESGSCRRNVTPQLSRDITRGSCRSG